MFELTPVPPQARKKRGPLLATSLRVAVEILTAGGVFAMVTVHILPGACSALGETCAGVQCCACATTVLAVFLGWTFPDGATMSLSACFQDRGGVRERACHLCGPTSPAQRKSASRSPLSNPPFDLRISVVLCFFEDLGPSARSARVRAKGLCRSGPKIKVQPLRSA